MSAQGMSAGRMSTRRLSDDAARRLAWAALGLSVVGHLAGIGLYFTLLHRVSVLALLATLLFLAFPVSGLLIARGQPQNRIAWILLAIGVIVGLGLSAEPYARYGLEHPGTLPAAAYVAALSGGLWVPAIGLVGTFLVLLFPNGQLPSPRWRPLARLSGAAIIVGYATFTLAPEDLEQYGGVSNPLGIGLLAPALRWLLFLLPVLPVCMLGCAAGLVVRFRRSSGVERLQLKWLAAAGSVVMSIYLLSVLASWYYDQLGDGSPHWLDALDAFTVVPFILIPGSIAVAVMKHGLYGIDRVISRSLSYAIVTGTLLAGYAAIVTGVGRLAPNGSSVAVAGSTLAVAALFQPLRRRVQIRVDRRFNRSRYDADRTIEVFRARLRDEVDLDSVRADLLGVVGATLQPASAGLWVRSTAERTT